VDRWKMLERDTLRALPSERARDAEDDLPQPPVDLEAP
jgi:hypothetical protein